MKRGVIIVLLLIVFLTVTACQNVEYEMSFHKINGETIYVMKENKCRTRYSEKVAEKDGQEYHISTCKPAYYTVYIDGKYIDLIEYIKENEFTDDQIIASNIVERYYSDSIADFLNIDLNNLDLISVTVRVRDGEIVRDIMNKGTETFTYDVTYEDIQEEIETILSRSVESEYNVCFALECETFYGPSPDFRITLSDGKTSFVITIDEGKYLSMSEKQSVVDREYFEVTITDSEKIAKALDSYFVTLFKQQKE